MNINKVKLTRPCHMCGMPMYIVRRKKGGVYKRSYKWWECSNKTLCGHKELEETDREEAIREGVFDQEIGVLPLTNTDDILLDNSRDFE